MVIPPVVFEELLVNAFIHRDYLVSAPIRLFIFDNRIEIVSPGHLPDNLTVEKIRAGNSNIRNPILVSHIAKGLLPYRGLASGIQRALEAWPDMEFVDDREGCLFTVTIHRAPRPKRRLESPTQSSDPVHRLVMALGAGALSAHELRTVLGIRHRHTFRQNYLRPALRHGVIELTIPDKPNSRLQKYRLKEVGRGLLAGLAGGESE